MTPSVWALAWRLLRRDLRSGELTLLFAALTLAVVIVTSISLFAERLQKAMVADTRVFLAADMVLQGPEPASAAIIAQATQSGLHMAQTVQFPSMVVSGNDMYLSSVKAVSAGYPLLGELEVATDPAQASQKVKAGPPVGEAWIDNRLLHLLDLHIQDRITLGRASFTVTRILQREPDSGSSYWSLGPRVMINLQDVPATDLIQPGSRVEYRHLFAGDEQVIAQFGQWLKPRLDPHQRLLTLQESQPGLAQSLERAEQFLLLAGSLGVLLAFIAIAMAARRYSVRHTDMVAVMKTLGATPDMILTLAAGQLSMVLVAGIATGWCLGWFGQHLFLQALREWLPPQLPPASLKPWFTGALTAIAGTVLVAFPQFLQLRAIPPLRVLRRDVPVLQQHLWLFPVAGVAAVLSLMFYYSRSATMTLYLAGGVAAAALVSGIVAWFLLGTIRHFGMRAGSAWRLAVTNLRRARWQTLLQLVMFGLALMLLMISILVRTSLVREWQARLPEGTPNHFLINIGPEQLEAVQQLLTHAGLQTAGMYPMVRGRLIAVNGRDVTDFIDRKVEEANRELNLTWSADLPEDNHLVAGAWWSGSRPVGSEPRVSIEKALARKLQINVGDTVTFLISSEKVTVRVTSVRDLQWDRMRPNFYFIFESGTLDNFAPTYITSFYLPKEKKLFINEFLKTFPTITVLEVDQMIERIQLMVVQVTRAIEVVLGLVLVSGALVLVASIQASLDHRLHENALLRALGAGRRLIIGALCVEFTCLGIGAGVIAAAGSELSAWALQANVLHMDTSLHPWLWYGAPLAGALLIGTLGVLSCLRVVRVAPTIVLREFS